MAKEDKTVEEQRHDALTKEIEAKKKEIKERKAKEIEAGFLNPLGEGTSYAEFLAEVEKSKKSVAEYCKGKLDKVTLAWIEEEINLLKQ